MHRLFLSLLWICGLPSVAWADPGMGVPWTLITHQGRSEVQALGDPDGHWLFPLADTLRPLGFSWVPCERCGHDEVSPVAGRTLPGGPLLVRWGARLAVFSALEDGVRVLSSVNIHRNGQTWVCTDVFNLLGFRVSLDEKNHQISVIP